MTVPTVRKKMNNRFRCNTPVSFEQVSDGYYAQCPECDEDLFSFEVE